VFEDGRSESYLIKPAPSWVDWDPGAEALHGISRAMLEAEGVSHDVVAHRLLDRLSDHVVYASAPSWDGKWLSVLFRAAGIPRHAMRLKDTDEAYVEAAVEVLSANVPLAEVSAIACEIVGQALDVAEQCPVGHRALADAEQARQIWLEIRRLAQRRGGP
jgi:DNA polymerase III epsilon subunit-like protein